MRTRINVESGIADFVMELDVDVNTLKFSADERGDFIEVDAMGDDDQLESIARFIMKQSDDAADDSWKGDGEWVEVSLADAKPGDVAEFVCTLNGDGNRYHGKLSNYEDAGLVIDVKDFVGSAPPSAHMWGIWGIRDGSGYQADGMRDLHIWRKLDPKRFDEPNEDGMYVSQSGILLYRSDGSPNWMNLTDEYWPCGHIRWLDWYDVRRLLDDSEFPLTHITADMARGMVGGDAE